MLSIRAEFLTGRYVATDPYGHDEPEWPPHPGRLFAAMAAAYFEGGQDGGERGALEWLERLGPPSISYDNKAVFPRETVYCFVPVNDRDKFFTPGQVSLGTLDLRGGRLRKERSFPTTVTGLGPVMFEWDDADAGDRAGPLGAICSRVHRLGHSSSIVHLTVGEDAQEAGPSLIPSEWGEQKIRWVSPGTLEQFENAYDVGGGKNRQERLYFVRKARLNAIAMLPVLYAPPQGGPNAVPTGQFAQMHVFEFTEGAPPSLVHARAISRAVKTALLGGGSGANAEAVSGLDTDGRPTTEPHVSVVSLAAVGHRHADGRARGVAIVMPRGLDEGSTNSILISMRCGLDEGSGLLLDVPGHGNMRLEPHAEGGATTLDTSAWTRRSRVWVSVTPIVLDRAPRARGSERDAEISRIVGRSCTLQGLPEPAVVSTSNVPYVPGPPLSSAFPLYTIPQRGEKPAEGKAAAVARVHAHARIVFDEAVRGPIILGAGRYNGYGLFWPRDGGP